MNRDEDYRAEEMDLDSLVRGEDDAAAEGAFVTGARAPFRAAMWLPALSIVIGVDVTEATLLALSPWAAPPAGSAMLAQVVSPAETAPPASAPRPEATPAEASKRIEAATVSAATDPSWVARVAESTPIPPQKLAAYDGAALVAAEETLACGFGWNTLAGIGVVESEHGTIHGSMLGDDGIGRPAIVGIPLDVTASLVARDSDGGSLDGGICNICQTMQPGNQVALFSARKAGPAGRRGDSIGTYICADLSCHENVRLAHPLAPNEIRADGQVDMRLDGTRRRMERFVTRVQEDTD